ncbi:hypothetical protein IQ244_28870 [Nostoc sp. LEGE 06077]|uniref:hypothetical protein n=1 Tax=Nostoc sp. LEGE 06077 TaxID=915325 RepID=UPI0018820D43|nr:hypothetical protein [Nostoc sp. LEGE 06077]MBE9210446.1 hypothetical protein [Nostoc sp. LEGE 06077]
MENITKRQSLLELIQSHLNAAPESTLEKVLELLEDEEEMRYAYAEIADSKINGTISWDEYKKERAKSEDPQLLR